jgi:hypothetical protein
MRTSKFMLAAIAGVALVSQTGVSHAAHFVVAEARGVGKWHAGNSIDGSASISLRQGQHLELISETGETLQLDGPFDGVVSASGAGAGLVASLSALITEKAARTSEVGTTRGQAIHALPAPWLIDVTHAGSACAADTTAPVFWRPDVHRTATLVVMPDDRSWKATQNWAPGSDRLTVETEVPMRTGAVYLVSYAGNEVAIRLVGVPNSLTNDAMRAAWMANKGCEAQAQALAHPHR